MVPVPIDSDMDVQISAHHVAASLRFASLQNNTGWCLEQRRGTNISVRIWRERFGATPGFDQHIIELLPKFKDDTYSSYLNHGSGKWRH